MSPHAAVNCYTSPARDTLHREITQYMSIIGASPNIVIVLSISKHRQTSPTCLEFWSGFAWQLWRHVTRSGIWRKMIFAFDNDTTDYYILPFLALWSPGLDAAWPGPIILLAGTADFTRTPHPHHTGHNPYIVPPSWKWMHSWIHTFLFYLNVCHLSAFVELMVKVTRLREDSIIFKSWSRGHGYFIFHNTHDDAAAVNWSSYFNQ